jgi:hypothetical protein
MDWVLGVLGLIYYLMSLYQRYVFGCRQYGGITERERERERGKEREEKRERKRERSATLVCQVTFYASERTVSRYEHLTEQDCSKR